MARIHRVGATPPDTLNASGAATLGGPTAAPTGRSAPTSTRAVGDGWFGRFDILAISHETIYRHIWTDKARGGTLHTHLRCAQKQLRKRYGAYDSRGRLAGKRPITTRPAGATNRSHIGHWEIDTVMGSSQGGACIMTMVERVTGFLIIGKLERRLPVKFYFAAPHHSWERGSNENTNGLIRQYFPKGVSMEDLTQADCDRIAAKINQRPRKRYDWHTPEERYAASRAVLHFEVDFKWPPA